jgi:protein-S-isoprenylcysteine O-methyltransferase Ste14
MIQTLDRGPQKTARKAVLTAIVCIGVPFFAVTSGDWSHPVHHVIESIGIFMIAVCIIGRTLCAFYISGRKNNIIVEEGPFSVCRNPLYMFSVIGAGGVGASTGSLVAGIAAATLTSIIFAYVVRKEEQSLEREHGESYRSYKRRVPRFLPRFKNWQVGKLTEVNAPGIARTFFDSCLFLLAIPVVEAIQYLKHLNIIPTIVGLP